MFDNLVETRKSKGIGAAKYLPVAIAAHIAAILVMGVVNLLAVEPVDPPTIKVVFMSAAAPPPPPPPPAPRRRPKPKADEPKPKPTPVKPATVIPEIVQPELVPEALPEVLDDAGEDEGFDEGLDYGVEGGVEGGVAGGVVGGDLGGVDGGVADDEPLRVGGDVEAPEILQQVKPRYPEVAKAARVQGIVILEAIINREGRVEDVKVLRGHPLLDQAAMDAVQKWKFKPGRLNGKPVPVFFTLTVNFTLR